MSDEDMIRKIFAEHDKAVENKSAIGEKGLFEQNRINERFYFGDQWHGVKSGAKKPLIRLNVIKRIGEYKQAVIAKSNPQIVYSALGVPENQAIMEKADSLKNSLFDGGELSDDMTDYEFAMMMKMMSGYFKSSALRTGLYDAIDDAMRKAYITGSGAVYMYWDNDVNTGVFADDLRTVPILGDVGCATVDIENIDFGDMNESNLQNQPYIIISGRMSVDEIRTLAKKYGADDILLDKIRPDYDYSYMSGDYGANEPYESRKATVLTKMYKVREVDGVHIKAVQVCRGCVVRDEWDLRIRKYPLAIFKWDSLSNCAYGMSEVTSLIPNQTAINRMLTANVRAVTMNGMPMLLVNGEVIKRPVTNAPGQILSFCGDADEFEKAVKYINPPQFSEQYLSAAKSLIDDTMSLSGANRAAVGDDVMNNAAALQSLQSASSTPLEVMIRRYRGFMREIADIFAEYMVCCYGRRKIRISDENGVWYMPFDSKRYHNLIINAADDEFNDGFSTAVKESVCDERKK